MVPSSHPRSGGEQLASGDTTPGWGAIHWPRGLTKLTQITAIPVCVYVSAWACVGGEEVCRGGSIHSPFTPYPKNLCAYLCPVCVV